jgi:chromosome segregation ATPase
MENLNSFIQILLWIVLPILTLAIVVTVILHYWRKRKEAKNPSTEEFLEPPPVTFEAPPVIEPTLNLTLENKDVTMNYTDEIEKNREIIAHLKSEFSFLEKKYEELKTARHNNNNNTGDASVEKTAALNEMLHQSENKIASLSDELQQFKNTNGEYAHSIEQLKSEIAALKNADHHRSDNGEQKAVEMETKLKEAELQLVILHEEMNGKLKVKEQEFVQLQLEREKLVAETMELKQQVNVYGSSNEIPKPSHSDAEYENLLKENGNLKNKVADYSYFDDLVNEKKQQISFLENQIEQRVRQVHDTEQNFYAEMKKVEMYGAQIASLKAEYDDTSGKLAEQIKVHDNQIIELDRLKNESQQQGNIINAKQHFISELENTFKLEKESAALLQQTIAADKMTISQLTQQTEDQFRKIEELEGKLKISSQLLARIYTDLGKSFASIFSDDMNILLPENSKIKELSKEFNGVQQGEVVYHS